MESVAGEYGARMTAMEAASKNAREMINVLTIQYNKAARSASRRSSWISSAALKPPAGPSKRSVDTYFEPRHGRAAAGMSVARRVQKGTQA